MTLAWRMTAGDVESGLAYEGAVLGEQVVRVLQLCAHSEVDGAATEDLVLPRDHGPNEHAADRCERARGQPELQRKGGGRGHGVVRVDGSVGQEAVRARRTFGV